MALRFAWHIHHDILIEPLTEPIAVRRKYIKEHKPKAECVLRLSLLRAVKGRLPEPVVEARRAYNKAGRAYNEARRAYNKAWRAYNEARRAYNKARRACNEAWRAYNEAWRACNEAGRAYNEAWRINGGAVEALHRAECPDCPWDGETIFGKGT